MRDLQKTLPNYSDIKKDYTIRHNSMMPFLESSSKDDSTINSGMKWLFYSIVWLVQLHDNKMMKDTISPNLSHTSEDCTNMNESSN